MYVTCEPITVKALLREGARERGEEVGFSCSPRDGGFVVSCSWLAYYLRHFSMKTVSVNMVIMCFEFIGRRK